MKPIRVKVKVNGRVQGVGFRHFTYKTATRLGLTGWVRNLPDGAVEAVAEGPQTQVEKWLAALKEGPPASRVEGLAVHREIADNSFDRFEVRF
ncbi:MAG: acylphosphatase [Desulfuromonadales bacterium]|nr:acylphosphatase [Desulfuromonadales bacterium]